MKIILLNGPPRVGKSTAARFIAADFGAEIIGFSYHLKRMVHGIYFGAPGWDMDPDCFDAVKSEPQPLLDGMSWRQAYIHYSERVIKPLHGKEWFGRRFVEAAYGCRKDIVVVPDSGFVDEANAVVRDFGVENVTLIRLHWEGCSFDGDSRSYIELPGVASHNINNVDMDALRADLRSIVAGA